MISIDDFFAKWMGQEADWDGAYAGQCVDLFRYYCHEVLGISQPDGVWGAANFWVDFETDSVLKANFDRIPNTVDFVPKKGDVMVWDWDAGGGFGHIGIVSDDNGTITYFNSFDQNWSRISYCEIVKHNYNNVYGVLRPKKGNMADTIPVDKKTYEMLVGKATKYDEFVKIGYSEPYKVTDLVGVKENAERERDQANIKKNELYNKLGVSNQEDALKKIDELSKSVDQPSEPAQPNEPIEEPTTPEPEMRLESRVIQYEKEGKTYHDKYVISQ